MCIICAKDNGAVAHLGYIDILYTTKQPVQHAILSFSLFSLLSKRWIFQVLQSFLYLETFQSKKAVLWMFTQICKKKVFCCLLFLNSGNMTYFVFLISRIYTNGYWSIANWGNWILPKSLRRISKVLVKFYYVTIFKNQIPLVNKMVIYY